MGRNRRIVTHSSEETIEFGAAFGASLKPNTVLCLFGELGSGKTTFVKGVVQGVTGIAPDLVVSPTFVYLNIYETIYHFDLYRLHDCDEFLSLGFEEYFFAGGVCCIEWSERIAPIIPEGAIKVTLSHLREELREISISES
ncbi:MAG: tRNA (adenosine(37)-N6)-threonylcarbamoyltransferase complex ATPase subunit type 1 TsaE [Chlamydiales bacterium]|nr:tRNA (adenosine(37)-N6)-threonylcarbamoyltransferase complex ATPase subunit type 1 TsaE [Chlamydiales bacterium]